MVARVAVDVPLAHLDRLFDYAVPEPLADAAVVGARVKVRFAGTTRDGWIVEIADHSELDRLADLSKVVSSEPVVTPEVYSLIRAVADHYAGTWSDVARLAIPPRHATTEKAPQREWPAPKPAGEARVLPAYPHGEELLSALAAGHSPRVLWQAAAVHGGPGDLIGGVIEAVSATVSSGRSAVVVVPTVRELDPTVTRFRAVFGHGAVGSLAAEAGRSARYRTYLAASRGEARIIVGTRSAVFAPVRDLGLVVVVDDGHDALEEPRSPHPHARAVAVLRAARQNCAIILAGHGRSTEAQALVERGWLRDLSLTPAAARRVSVPVRAVSEDDRERDPTAARLRIPSLAFRFLRDHLSAGPVLVQVPMVGHSASLTCQRCRNRALCAKCSGPMRERTKGVPECALCGHRPVRWSCPHCHTSALSTPLPGAARTAEELARAFPGVLAVNSSADRIRDAVPDEPAIVVATPGAEPASPSGYAGALVLDGEVTLQRADLRAAEEAVRRWSNAASLVRAPADGGSVLIVGPSAHPAVQALLRADLAGFSSRELADRAAAGLAPAVKLARLVGDAEALREFLDNDDWAGIEILGPTEVGPDRWAALLRTPVENGRELARRVKSASAIRSARKERGLLSIHIDPESLEDR
ncbi:hypothetical protein [Tessaracoccus flavus]|uniref:Probable replication restart protein PriA n=1 Tax=Tessaracoccus flavus TaxID=1610493 RepID=A0A1Q2CE95_9ACTN|nr:hypothetical protein [Tessaracoccus flavus]AQP44444.1 hypothetical protein RPIT_06145 [Tessaracoccus flavus]SDY69547.1 replication restart DNA helicase PriA [Tessaracoccus flavus]